ncbi:MAG: DDE-type integrase/transposase/recombinase [Rhodobacteraceae bacterium]|nr:DDE-type integrase/transposase/recombinase [Paracoccaceae bacterium]
MPHDTRDLIVDFVRSWADKTEIPVARFTPWLAITRSKFEDWRQRYGKVNEHNHWIPRDHWLTDDEILRLCGFARQHPLEGYRRLTFMALDADVVACSPASTYRVLKKNGLLAGHAPKPTKKGTGYVQPLTPHQEWHIDISYLNIAGTFYFACSILDGYSRFLVHHEIRKNMEEVDVEIILQRAREKFPDAKPRIISDNGPQFIAKDFKEFIRVAGMTHVRTSPYYPQSNGKIERWHKTLKGDCIRVQVPLSLEEARRIMTDFVDHYNNVRLHSAVGYVTPKDKLLGNDPTIHTERDRKLAEARDRRKQMRQTRQEKLDHRADSSRPALDFAAIRAAVAMAAVLELLGCQANSHYGAQHRGPCPLHGSTSGTSRCFSAHTANNYFHCFKCGRSGNALDLWAAAQRLNIYDAAIDLCQRLHLPIPVLAPTNHGNRDEETVADDSTTCTIP